MAAGDTIDETTPVNADELVVAYGEACATLTPRIKEALRNVTSGGVVEVRTDEPSAREDVAAWARLTGNPVINVVEEDDRHTRFFIRKK